jgi:hypothetical protein
MSVIQFPTQTPAREARLVREERRVEDWFDSLSDEARQQWFTLYEIKAATLVPLARLPSVLYRLRWKVRRERGFALTLFQGPFEQARRAEREAMDAWIAELTRDSDNPDKPPAA